MDTPVVLTVWKPMEFERFDPGTCKFPAPRVAMLPNLSASSLALPGVIAARPGASSASFRNYARSRYALKDAYSLSGATAGTVVLIPAYHCRTMLDPALQLGAQVSLYPVLADLTPDLEALEAVLAREGQRAVALLATHFFGFQQDFSALIALCERFEVTVIEDCSHCLFPGSDSSNLGSVGRYGVWSPYKFYPCEDGGLLQANRGAAMPAGRSRSQGLWLELRRAVQRLLLPAGQPRRLDVGKLRFELEVLMRRASAPGVEVLESNNAPSIEYSPELEQNRSLALSRLIMRWADVPRIRSQRRRRYEQWLQATAVLPSCRPLVPILPVDCVPYMFPMYIDRPEAHFMLLKQLGMPVWRWDNMARSNCPVSNDYRTHLLQLPCHQELSDREMAWMVAAVTAVLQVGVSRVEPAAV